MAGSAVTVTGQRSPLPADGLRREAEAYLAMRRTLGFKLSTQAGCCWASWPTASGAASSA